MGRSIREGLAGRTILLTGATGFLGKVLLEKLLWSVPDVRKVFVLGRPSASQSAEERVMALFTSTLGTRLRWRYGLEIDQFLCEKIEVLSGDLSRDELGLSTSEYATLCTEVDLVIGSAASVTFDERLDVALQVNVLGAMRAFGLARRAGAPVVHVSTCYVSGGRDGLIGEALPYLSVDPHRLLERLQRHCESGASPEDLVEAGMSIAREVGFRDTYTMTKALAELLLASEHGSLPLAIVRPSIIEGAWAEPQPGWIEGLRMADPVLTAYGRGLLRRFPGNSRNVVDLIPVDFVANAVLAVAGTLEVEGATQRGPSVYQIGSSRRNPLTLGVLARHASAAFREWPMKGASGRNVRVRPLRFVGALRFARALEWRRRAVRLGLRASPRTASWASAWTGAERVWERLQYLGRIYGPYLGSRAVFDDTHLQALRDRLSLGTREEFPFDAAVIDWKAYLVDKHIPGVRQYVLGDSREPTSAALSAAVPRPPEGAHLFDLFEQSRLRSPGATAFQAVSGGRALRYSYAQAETARVTVARHLRDSHGIARGDRVAIWADSGVWWSLTALSVLSLDATIVPLDPQWTWTEVQRALEHTGAKILCVGPRLRFSVERSPRGIAVVPIGPPLIPDPDAPPELVEVPRPRRDPNDVAAIFFTSGTSLKPKAVPLTHTNLSSNVHGILHTLWQSRPRMLSVLPLHHVMEFTGGLLVPLVTEGSITYLERIDGPSVLAGMRACRPTAMLIVPRVLDLFLTMIERRFDERGTIGRRLYRTLHGIAAHLPTRWRRRLFRAVHQAFGGHLELFVVGGAALGHEVRCAFERMGFTIVEAYGMTEAGPVMALTRMGERSRGGVVGPHLPGVELRVDGEPGREGEILARGPGVMEGYLDNPEDSRAVLEDGWLRTGDLGSLDTAGYLRVTGRAKDVIVTSSGKNIHPEEIEAKLRGVPGVRELCVVGGRMGGALGEQVHVVVRLEPHGSLVAIEAEIERRSKQFPTYQRVARVHSWEGEFPKTSTLKIKRVELRRLVAEGRVAATPATALSPQTAGVEPRDETQRWLYREIARLAQVPEASLRADQRLLSDLGIDSLSRVYLVSLAESRTGRRYSDEAFLKVERISDLVALIAAPAAVGGAKTQQLSVQLDSAGP